MHRPFVVFSVVWGIYDDLRKFRAHERTLATDILMGLIKVRKYGKFEQQKSHLNIPGNNTTATRSQNRCDECHFGCWQIPKLFRPLPIAICSRPYIPSRNIRKNLIYFVLTLTYIFRFSTLPSRKGIILRRR